MLELLNPRLPFESDPPDGPNNKIIKWNMDQAMLWDGFSSNLRIGMEAMVAMWKQYVLNREMLNLELVSHAQSSLLATTSTPASFSRVGGAATGDHRDLRDGCIIQNVVSCVIGVFGWLAQSSNVFPGKAANSRSSYFVPVLN